VAGFEPSPSFRDAPPWRSGVLLVNSGTPDALSTGGVRRFLRRLLRDRRTIEVPRAIWCWILYCIILPLRPARVLPKYRRVWTQRGSPLLLHSLALRDALRARLRDARGEPVAVELGMLYSTPDVAQGLAALRAAGAQRILVLPLFPQYSGTTNAAAMDQVGAALRAWRYVPELHLLPDYAIEPAYVEALAASVRAHRARHGAGDHLLITFHGRGAGAEGHRLDAELPVARGHRRMAQALYGGNAGGAREARRAQARCDLPGLRDGLPGDGR
jgi:ferrochelatase